MNNNAFCLWSGRVTHLDHLTTIGMLTCKKWGHYLSDKGRPTVRLTYKDPQIDALIREWITKSHDPEAVYDAFWTGMADDGWEGRADELDSLLDTYGVESSLFQIGGVIVRVEYLNAGYTYNPTLLRVGRPANEYADCRHGPWQVGCWGDWAEREDPRCPDCESGRITPGGMCTDCGYSPEERTFFVNFYATIRAHSSMAAGEKVKSIMEIAGAKEPALADLDITTEDIDEA